MPLGWIKFVEYVFTTTTAALVSGEGEFLANIKHSLLKLIWQLPNVLGLDDLNFHCVRH
jgi:hypothetical protein